MENIEALSPTQNIRRVFHYEYTRIPVGRFIRVARLKPAFDLASPLHCSMDLISLDDMILRDSLRDNVGLAVNYTALSYAWESQRPSKPIWCDGKLLLVTRNCTVALRRLRRKQEKITLWVDSICIEQKKTIVAMEERNRQAALMGEVYALASRVVVWFGESDPDMTLALATIVAIYNGIDPSKLNELTKSIHSRKDMMDAERRGVLKTIVKDIDMGEVLPMGGRVFWISPMPTQIMAGDKIIVVAGFRTS